MTPNASIATQRTTESAGPSQQHLDDGPLEPTPQPQDEITVSDPVLTSPCHEFLSHDFPVSEDLHASLSGPQFTPGSDANPIMAIPLDHSTTTGELLRSAPAQALLGPYPADTFLHIELERSVPQNLELNPTKPAQADIPAISRDNAADLLDSFFDNVHPLHPIVDQIGSRRICNKIFDQDLIPDLETAHALILLALGHVSRKTPSLSSATHAPGSGFLPPAIGRPLQAWRLVHMASTEVQHYWIRKLRLSSAQQQQARDQSILRLCWAIFIMECDIVAEHHLPRSGIENVVEKLPLPRLDDSPEPFMLRWLAHISSRRLLNRIHFVLYDNLQSNQAGMDTDTSTPAAKPLTSTMFGITRELNDQLHAWFELLPDTIKPSLKNEYPTIDEAVLAMRFHAAGDIIHRPFLQHRPTASLEIFLHSLSNTSVCIQFGRHYRDPG
ncbi:hypothetical protein FSARC_12125 [Fusarium sarcochroum]|uniref:Transcription factor domain-containing protein n=1 Tax=Fusarium sarcochroum TaxID=1208366 RepID=A0A8H4WXX4_9HYPO|nr:hypothetical protein FSARC_12125 [Fusarium sarcochroum]